MKSIVGLILLAILVAVIYSVIKERMRRNHARHENAMNVVDITDVPSYVVDETIPTASTPAFDPLAEDMRPAEGIRKERDFIENPVDDSLKDQRGNPYAT